MMSKRAKHHGPLKDYYAVLGVPKSASQKAIQQAFRQLAQKFHPDLNPDPEATEKFQELVEAYQALKVPEKRNQFDARIMSEFCKSYLSSFKKEDDPKPKKKRKPEFYRILRK